MSRADRVLDVFPSAYRAGDPNKLLANVVRALAQPLEEADVHAMRIQRAHRLLVAESAHDIVRLAEALNLGAQHFEDIGNDEDLTPTQRLDHMRDRVQRVARLHLRGLGTPAAILEAAAIFLDAQLVADADGEPVVKHVDGAGGYVHRATVELTHRPGKPRAQLVLFENPLQRRKIEPTQRWPLDSWTVTSHDSDGAPMSFAIRGVADRTVRPTVFSPDANEGVLFDGVVPDGSLLLVDRTRGAELDGVAVDDWIVHFTGQTYDFGTLDDHAFSVDEGPVATRPFDETIRATPPYQRRRGTPAAPLGDSTWVFGVAEGVFDGAEHDFAVYATEHLPVGVLDADVAYDGCVYDLPASAIVGAAWDERTPCSFKLSLPHAFPPSSDEEGGRATNHLGVVGGVMGRFKAAGVRAYVGTARAAWVLGRGVVRSATATAGQGVDTDPTTIRGLESEGFVPIEGPP